jgi:hypothetical protein
LSLFAVCIKLVFILLNKQLLLRKPSFDKEDNVTPTPTPAHMLKKPSSNMDRSAAAGAASSSTSHPPSLVKQPSNSNVAGGSQEANSAASLAHGGVVTLASLLNGKV